MTYTLPIFHQRIQCRLTTAISTTILFNWRESGLPVMVAAVVFVAFLFVDLRKHYKTAFRS